MLGSYSAQTRAVKEADEYSKVEIVQVVQRVSSLENIRLQIGTFLGTANLTSLTLAMSMQKAGVMFLGTALVILFLTIDIYMRREMVPYFYRGLQLQRRLVPDDEEAFLHLIPGALPTLARKISDLGNSQDRKAALNRIHVPVQSPFFRIFVAVAVSEAGLGLLLWLKFMWPAF